jgi:hypothetical protein
MRLCQKKIREERTQVFFQPIMIWVSFSCLYFVCVYLGVHLGHGMHKGDLRIIQSLSKETPKDLPRLFDT